MSSKAAEANYQPRNVIVLQELGAVSPEEAELMRRASRLQSDQRAWLDNPTVTDTALKLLGAPTVAQSLFPEEKEMGEALLEHLRWPEVPEAANALEVTPEGLIDMSEVGNGFGATASCAVDELPDDLQEVARRAELVLNGEVKETVSLGAVEATHTHDAFLPSEQRDMLRLRGVLVERAKIPGTTMNAIIEVPRPGEQRIALPHSGSTELFVVSTINIAETVTVKKDVVSPVRTLTMTREFHFEVDVPEGEHVALMKHPRSTGIQDIVLSAGTHPVKLERATYRIERWRDGERLESSDINIINPERQEQEMHPYCDYEFRHAGTPIPRVITDIVEHTDMHRGGASTKVAHFVHSFDATPNPKLDPTPFEPRRALRLEAGRYQVSDITIDVFDSGAVRVKSGDREFTPMNREEHCDDRMTGGVPRGEEDSMPRVLNLSTTGLLKIQQAYGSDSEVQLGPEYKVN